MSIGARAVRACQELKGVSRYTPVLFECSQLKNEWLKSEHWIPENMSKLTPTLHVKRSKNKHFMYIEGGRKDLLQDDGEDTSIVELESSVFFDKCSKQTIMEEGGDFHYFTGRVQDCFPSIMPTTWNEYIIERDIEGISDPDSHGYLSVWLGGMGSTTQSHYDIANNCFLQLHGEKRVRVWHPNQHTQMYPYPDAHPRARKSRLNIDQVQGLDTPFLDVVLQPGDALYIPSFYFHHVEVVSSAPSVSLNVFSQSKISRGFGRVLSMPPPKFHDQTKYAKEMRHMADQLSVSSSTLYDMYRSRFQPAPINLKQITSKEEAMGSSSPVSVDRLSISTQRYINGFQETVNEYIEEDSEYVTAVRDICFSHLTELVALRNFGASEVDSSLRSISK